MRKLYFSFLLCAAFYGLASSVSATITLQMSNAFAGSIASNFGNAAGVATDGMNWGIVVDTGTGGGVFAAGSYTSFNISTAGFLSTANGLTDDYFIPSASLTSDSSFASEAGGASGGHGTITTITGVPIGGATNIAAGQLFALIWFSSNSASTAGAPYGFFTNAALTIPADGQTVDRSAPFAGVDPVRAAANSIAVVPEPSSLILLGGGAALLIRRRFLR